MNPVGIPGQNMTPVAYACGKIRDFSPLVLEVITYTNILKNDQFLLIIMIPNYWALAIGQVQMFVAK